MGSRPLLLRCVQLHFDTLINVFYVLSFVFWDFGGEALAGEGVQGQLDQNEVVDLPLSAQD